MYPPIGHCLRVVLFATPSMMTYFICAPFGGALPMLGLCSATNPFRDNFLRLCFVSAERSKNAPFRALTTAPYGSFNT